MHLPEQPGAPEVANFDDDDDHDDNHLVLDIIWSPGGLAYVEVLSSMELAVGTVDLGKRRGRKVHYRCASRQHLRQRVIIHVCG